MKLLNPNPLDISTSCLPHNHECKQGNTPVTRLLSLQQLSLECFPPFVNSRSGYPLVDQNLVAGIDDFGAQIVRNSSSTSQGMVSPCHQVGSSSSKHFCPLGERPDTAAHFLALKPENDPAVSLDDSVDGERRIVATSQLFCLVLHSE